MPFRNLYLFFVLVSVQLAAGCGKDLFLKGAGPVTRVSRQLPSFNQINLYNRINLILTQDTAQAVTVEAGEHLVGDIETTVSGNALTIRDNNKYNWARDMNPSINVYISMAGLQKIGYYGAGNITCTNTLVSGQLVLDSWMGIGSINLNINTNAVSAIVREDNADMTLSGKSREVYVYCAHEGAVDLRNLASETALVESKSINDVYVNVSKMLDARILYKGNVYYRGHPMQIDITKVNSGQLIHIP